MLAPQAKVIMSDVECPYCKEDFDVHDHYESGEYECPMCGESIWVEVEYTVSYDASCLDRYHKWVDYSDPYRPNIQMQKCETCGGLRVKPTGKGEL